MADLAPTNPESSSLVSPVAPTVPLFPSEDTKATETKKPEDSLVKEWQAYLKSSPLGVGYAGLIDGQYNPDLLTSIKNLEIKLKEIGKSVSIISGDKFVISPSVIKQDVDNKDNASKQLNSNLKEWKQYAKAQGLYSSGDVESPDIDEGFHKAIVTLESKLSKDVPSISGLIWQGGTVNPNITVSQYEKALALLDKAKKSQSEKKAERDRFSGFLKGGQATLEDIGPPQTPDNLPKATNPMPTQEDRAGMSEDPDTSQQQGKTQLPIPGAEKKQKNLDDQVDTKQQQTSSNVHRRMKLLTKMISNQ